ncbi:MAG: sugar epimerase [Flavobacterium sp.]|nr:sugar epimerase [Flavobacterium sp.]
MKPTIIKGGFFSDERGGLSFNNEFDATVIKRIYVIENAKTEDLRGWRGHQIERRWFAAVSGKFEIQLIEVDDWTKPSPNLVPVSYELEAGALDLLQVPPGYITGICAKEPHSRLLVLADYRFGEIEDEYRFEYDYFTS